MRQFNLLILFAVLLLASCSPELPDIGGDFTSEAWKLDEVACKGERAEMLDDILAAKDVLVQLREADVRQLFGRPDNVELFSRSQKFYLYYVEAGGQCAGQGGSDTGKMLELSLDALGRLHEINIRQ